MTISAVQHLKCLVDEINYPNNSIKMEILQLDAEARPFKKKIDRFLEKPKMQEEIHEEYRVMASKMIIKEAE